MLIQRENQIGVGCCDFNGNEKKYVNEVLDSGRLSYGPFSKKFEKTFAALHNCRHGVMVNSGTGALRIAVAALKEINNWQDGDEVIAPAVTFVATTNVIIDHGLRPVFADVDPVTYNIDPKKIEEKITGKTKAIMVVHLFGQPAEMDPILEIAKRYNLKIIEDSCETMFAKYKGRPVGSFGDVSCFSTYMAHILVTGVGGYILTNNNECAVICRSLANHGRDSIYIGIDDDKNLDEKGLSLVVNRRFKFERLGYSFRATEMEAAIGVAQLERWEEIIKKRQENAKFFIDNLGRLGSYLQFPLWPNYVSHSFMMFPIVVKDKRIKKADLVMFLEKYNIETRDMMPLLNQPIYKKLYGNIEERYPVAKWINGNGFYIGCHQLIAEEEREYIIGVFKEFFDNYEAINNNANFF
ncbi:DegT/DnrJ/EryC1/StrS family aminotransferase [Patescibacteria group bacterium]|nr:DegT/DnrJ/EryC1/StrS family aminotransferase [Patescibacteria group bacterium]